VDFRVLGPVAVYANGRQLALGPRQQRLVLAVLALEATKVVPVDQLVDLVWPDAPPRTAVHAIQVCVSRLRTVLVAADDPVGVELVGRDAGYVLLADPLIVDAHRFRQMVKQAKAADDEDRMRLLEEALGLWRGPALAGAASEQVRSLLCGGLEEARLAATEDLLQTRLRLKGHRDVVDELTELVSAHPLREGFVGQLMLAHYRGGRRSAALDLYEQTRRRMAEEFGADLSGPLQRLHLAMLRGDADLDLPAPTPRAQASGRGTDYPVPAQLPPVVAGFTGRATELSALDAALAASASLRADHLAESRTPTTVLITAIGGTPGVGKTALAVWWAQRVKDRFPDGQLFLNLRGFGPTGQPMPPSEAVRACLDALGVRPEAIPATLDAQVGRYRSLMAERRMLVVLDNAATAEQVRPLLPGTSSCVVVVTSRATLTGLVATEGARPITLDVFSPAESRELLGRRLGQARVDAEPDSVDEIVSRCARLPLALAVVAAQTALQSGFSLATVAQALRQAGPDLAPFADADPATDIRVVFSWSYRVLGPVAARLFRLSALHPGAELTEPGLASLAGVPPDEVLPPLAELVRAHLLTERQPGRYTCHDLLRAYATELVRVHETDAERHRATRRVLDYFLNSAYAAERVLNPNSEPVPLVACQPDVQPLGFGDHATAMAWLTSEIAILAAAPERAAAEGLDVHAWQLARSVATFLDLRGDWPTLAETHRVAEAAADRLGDLNAQAYAQRVLGRADTQLGRYSDAQHHHERALTLFTQAGNVYGQAQTHGDLSWLHTQQGDGELGLDHVARALELFRATGNRFGEVSALNGVGFCHIGLGRYREALVYCEQALAGFEEFGDRLGQADTWDSLGLAHHHLGDHDRAVECFERALETYREAGDRYREAETLTHLGDDRHMAGEVAHAGEKWRQALAILTELSHPYAEDVRAKLRALNVI